jgi:hypothetical protein
LIHIQCNQCGQWVTVLDGSNPGAALTCGCCTLDHNHDAAANACPGAGVNHEGAPCPAPQTCIALTPPDEDCPGGHCGLGVEGCTVCRPVTITIMSVPVEAV